MQRHHLNHVSADRCASLWAAAIKEQIKQATKGDEAAKLWLSNDGILIASMLGADVRAYWEQIEDLALS
ncbi:hypothetical protein K3740_08710 [Ruegeria conchae]|uniref:hypothetical protein n=1 Tax=Ruegeria conchae TaxID=981384 RepID=UPI0021A75A6B|nr:hypothetical protein [Ruegeria conchae]UWR04741.1 hypothetical protein K3740_08710 [Ruegeria conchae]